MNNSNNVSRMPSKKDTKEKKRANHDDSDSDASTDSKGNIRNESLYRKKGRE